MTLRACIRRGARQVGGTCIELEFKGDRYWRLVLDLGLPLDASLESPKDALLPDVEGLRGGHPFLMGIVISHGHPDHYGLVDQVHESIPVFVGAATERILREAAFFAPTGILMHAGRTLRDQHTFQCGPFAITPMLIDHSAFDAYALIVEAGGQRLLYSGDLRGHGRKRLLFERLIQRPPEQINTLLLEGTMITRSDTAGPYEEGVEESCTELFRSTKGLALACYSGQNIDRLVSLFRAARATGRDFVMDLYTAAIARATGLDSIPQPGWDGVRVIVPQTQRAKVIKAGEFERIDWVRNDRIFWREIAETPERFVLTFRGSMMREAQGSGALLGAQAVWSMWPGYLERPGGEEMKVWFRTHGVPIRLIHASGHASIGDLQRLARAVGADRVVPVHTNRPERYRELFENVELHADGEWWTV